VGDARRRYTWVGLRILRLAEFLLRALRGNENRVAFARAVDLYRRAKDQPAAIAACEAMVDPLVRAEIRDGAFLALLHERESVARQLIDAGCGGGLEEVAVA